VTLASEAPLTIDQAVRAMAAKLAKAGIEPAFSEARLIAELAGFDRMNALSNPRENIDQDQWHIMQNALVKRLAGMPVSRQRGWVMFDGRRFALTPETLEPREDTLALIDAVTPFVRSRPNCRILDIGTGTGIIALTLLARCDQAVAVATDISAEAMRSAQHNAEHLNLGERFSGAIADLTTGVRGKFDLIISNPPYIESGLIASLDREVREHDPLAALDGGADGLLFYRRIALEAKPLLADGGQVAVEIGFDQQESVAQIFDTIGYRKISFHKDLGGRPRALVFTML
jgi:release factor glutamine methyltransferase